MPIVQLCFDIRGSVTQKVVVPQSVIDQYNRETAKDHINSRALDRLLEPYINYSDACDQMSEPEDIELYELKEDNQ